VTHSRTQALKVINAFSDVESVVESSSCSRELCAGTEIDVPLRDKTLRFLCILAHCLLVVNGCVRVLYSCSVLRGLCALAQRYVRPASHVGWSAAIQSVISLLSYSSLGLVQSSGSVHYW